MNASLAADNIVSDELDTASISIKMICQMETSLDGSRYPYRSFFVLV